MATLFTRIMDGELPGRFVWRDDSVAAFLTIAPITAGHTLVVPRAEIPQWTELPLELLAHLMEVAQTIGKAQQRVWQAPRIGVMMAGFEVPHTHIHVLPIWGEADLSFSRADANAPADRMDADADTLREALIADGFAAQVGQD